MDNVCKNFRQIDLSTSAPQQSMSTNVISTSQYAADSIQLQSQNSSDQFTLAQQMAMRSMMHQMYLQYLNHYARASQSHVQFDNRFPSGIQHSPQNFENRPISSPMIPQQSVRQFRNIYQQAVQPRPQVQPPAQILQNDDEAENRDWLDILYTFSRLIVLLSLVYFYSSPGRCSVVILVMVLYYL